MLQSSYCGIIAAALSVTLSHHNTAGRAYAGEPKRKTAMISSTSLDLPEHRQHVMDACQRMGVTPIMMEHLPASDDPALQAAINKSLGMVNEADIYIGIFAHRYGWVPDRAGYLNYRDGIQPSRRTKDSYPRLPDTQGSSDYYRPG